MLAEEILMVNDGSLLLKMMGALLENQGFRINLTDSPEEALEWLAQLGYDPQFGARPLKRVIEKELVNELAKQVLAGSFTAGETIYIDVRNRQFVFSEQPFAAEVDTADNDATSDGTGEAQDATRDGSRAGVAIGAGKDQQAAAALGNAFA